MEVVWATELRINGTKNTRVINERVLIDLRELTDFVYFC